MISIIPSILVLKFDIWCCIRFGDAPSFNQFPIDDKYPTICGTGSEDYVGLSWGIQQTPFLYNGCSLNENKFVSMYRWHLPDPIAWQKECRITIQQIAWNKGLAEVTDDWSCATFWYEPLRACPCPPCPMPRPARPTSGRTEAGAL